MSGFQLWYDPHTLLLPPSAHLALPVLLFDRPFALHCVKSVALSLFLHASASVPCDISAPLHSLMIILQNMPLSPKLSGSNTLSCVTIIGIMLVLKFIA